MDRPGVCSHTEHERMHKRDVGGPAHTWCQRKESVAVCPASLVCPRTHCWRTWVSSRRWGLAHPTPTLRDQDVGHGKEEHEEGDDASRAMEVGGRWWFWEAGRGILNVLGEVERERRWRKTAIWQVDPRYWERQQSIEASLPIISKTILDHLIGRAVWWTARDALRGNLALSS